MLILVTVSEITLGNMEQVNISYLNSIPRQIKPENRDVYRYYLNDTIEIDGRKTYVIKFKEITNKQKQNPRKFNGKIYVDAENYALKKLESTSKKINEGNGTVIWKPIKIIVTGKQIGRAHV